MTVYGERQKTGLLRMMSGKSDLPEGYLLVSCIIQLPKPTIEAHRLQYQEFMPKRTAPVLVWLFSTERDCWQREQRTISKAANVRAGPGGRRGTLSGGPGCGASWIVEELMVFTRATAEVVIKGVNHKVRERVWIRH